MGKIIKLEEPEVEFVDENGEPLSDEELENQMEGLLNDLYEEYDNSEDE